MVEPFRAYMVDNVAGRHCGGFRNLTPAELPPHPVLVEVAYSSLNYKDGLAITGMGKIIRKFPMICGIDLAGTVIESADSAFKPADRVLVTGWGLSETEWGGYSQLQRVRTHHLTLIPPRFSMQQAMAIGTAGLTAMLSILSLQRAGLRPDSGDVLVTGAAGGVGSLATAVLAGLGYRVVAATGRPQTHEYLRSLGAAELISRAELSRSSRPLETPRWAGAVDSVGSNTLATVLAQLKDEAAVAACGVAGGGDLPATMMPFALRGVKLLGINSVTASAAVRTQAWSRLASDLSADRLASMTVVEPLSRIEALSEQILRGEVRGRIVIDVNQ